MTTETIDIHIPLTAEATIKVLILELLKLHEIHVVDDLNADYLELIQPKKLTISITKHHKPIVRKLKIKALETITDREMQRGINAALSSYLERLKVLDICTIKQDTCEYFIDGKTRCLTEVFTYTLTAKGLETALKLQEHDDNTQRFKQQKEISEVLKSNSTASVKTAKKSVTTARVALVISVILVGLGIWRVLKLEQKIESHTTMEARINALDAEVKELRKKIEVIDKNQQASPTG